MRLISVLAPLAPVAALAAVGLTGCAADGTSTSPAPVDRAAASGAPAPSAPSGESSPSSRPATTLDVSAAPALRPARLLAARIEYAERTIADRSSPAAAVRVAGEFEQLASRTLASAAPAPRRRVLADLDGRAAAVMRGDVHAATGLGTLTAPAPSLPKDWRIVAPLPAPELMRLYRAAERRTGVPWQYLAAINFVETKLGRIVGPSTAGAQGPMQFMPATWREYGDGGDVHDPRDAIPAAARFLADNGAPGDMAGALRAYNDSSYYVHAVTTYARVLRRWPGAFRGDWAWRVLYKTRSGAYLLPTGYPKVPALRLR